MHDSTPSPIAPIVPISPAIGRQINREHARDRLPRLERLLAALSEQYPADHPLVVRVRANLATARRDAEEVAS